MSYNYHAIEDKEYLGNYSGYTTLLKNDFVGNFAYNYNGSYISGVLLKLDSFDIENILPNIKLKENEILLRYVTDRMFINDRYYQKPLIKINTVKGLIYHLPEDNMAGDFHAIFQGRGIKLTCLNLIVAGVYNEYMKDCIDHLQVCYDKTIEMQNNKEIYNYNIK